MNIGNLDIHSEEDFRNVLKRAGRTIECSWFIGMIRHRSVGRWVPILVFSDEDKKEFSYAFQLSGGGAECEAFCSRLRRIGWKCDNENQPKEK